MSNKRTAYLRLRVAAVAVLTAVTTMLGLGVATPASAGTITPMACQQWAYRATIYFVSPPSTAYTCSGSHTPRNNPVVSFLAGNWSGYLIWAGRRVDFCNWDVIEFGGDVRLPVSKIYLSPTRMPGC